MMLSTSPETWRRNCIAGSPITTSTVAITTHAVKDAFIFSSVPCGTLAKIISPFVASHLGGQLKAPSLEKTASLRWVEPEYIAMGVTTSCLWELQSAFTAQRGTFPVL